MTVNPYVELLHSDLQPSALKVTEGRFLGTPAQQIEAALSTYRLLMINHVKAEIRKTSTMTGVELLRLADLASAIYLQRFVTLVGPSATASYIRAYRATQTGDVPMELIYALSTQHAERMGKYFHQTSKEAMLQGFNRLVNQKVPEKIAADRVVDAFGLTPRQMSGYIALEPMGKTHSNVARSAKAKALDYVGRSIRRRLKVFSTQEDHNLEEQAKQVAWMWMRDKDKLSARAEKVWMTAKDERTCKICRPMHGKRVLVSDRFKMPDGSELYVPGAHVNCRCEVRLVDPLTQVAKAWDEDEHPRAGDGRFKNKYSVATRTKERPDTTKFQAFLDQAAQAEEPEPEVTTFSMEPTRPDRMRLGQTFSMGSETFSMAQPTQTFSMQDTPTFSLAHPGFSLFEQQQISMGHQQAAMSVLNEAEMSLIAKPKKKVRYRETHKFDVPVYGFITSDQIDENGTVVLGGDERFTTNRAQIESGAGHVHMELVDRAVERAHESETDVIERWDEGGNTEYAYIDREDLYNVAGALSSSTPVRMESLKVPLKWTDHMGNETGDEEVSYQYIADHLGWSPADFTVFIMRVDEGHNGKRGETDPLGSHGTSWRMTGNFNTVYGGGAPAGPVGEIQILHGDPDTPMEEFGDNPDD